MADYGHDLSFGTFLTPRADAPTDVVALAQLTEQVGLDLVTVQDHPYQPAFLDAWTLLSVVAASTERVRVSPNVANLPLRPPAVLARSAASLDLLTGGRVELGLGAGAFWDAIVANGGPRRTPAESVVALDEAIRVIRAIWGRSGRGARVEGDHYRVTGAKVGPLPAHDIGIWVGAYKPRMLRLVGRAADGWLPSLGYLDLDHLAGMNETIDAAAVRAGRSPGDVRRLLNVDGTFGPGGAGPLTGAPDDWARRLADLTLTHGVSTFILASDDPSDIRLFGVEVAPRVRELVDAARAGAAATSGPTAPPGPTAGPTGATNPNGSTDRSAAGGGPAPAEPTPGRGGGDFSVPREIPGLGVTPTPDDGKRHSDTAVWDESTRPTGPAPEAGRRYSARERAQGQHLIDVHDHLRQELAQVRDLVDQVAAGALDVAAARSHINAMTLRQNNWTLGAYCESYCRLVTTHHTIEDVSMLPHLRRRDPRLGPVTTRLEEEHRIIHLVVEQVDRALVALVGGAGDLSGLRAAVDALTDALLSHLSYEERELVEPLARLGLG
ncbi:LLM class flavin-dependent oxidoreductase [Micromonospora sp. WMMD882]|uniref:LLM class flavin-dependent oxidoreductase n=1 Tax=Micromonospora sp. WMMD882 TaxID=3015151 RepID=UPI00248D1C3B|nr:LLM class flavin-dependent oxidoreductase [Micromonospora sp. WMMD882]WBB80506.1 LLM class flavin-dependent oxidoreductase [Micromonospora sp. WMMD882]